MMNMIKYSLLILAVVAVLPLRLVDTLKVTKVESITQDFFSNGNTIETVMTKVYFDVDLFVKMRLPQFCNLNWIRGPNQQQPYFQQSGENVKVNTFSLCHWMFMSALAKSSANFRPFELECSAQTGQSAVNHFAPAVSDFGMNFVMMPCSDDPIRNVMNFYLNVTSPSQQQSIVFDGKCMMLMFMAQQTDELTSTVAKMSPIDNLISLFNQGKCSLKVNSYFFGTSSAADNTKNFAVPSLPWSNHTVMPRTCDLKKLTTLLDEFQVLLSNVNNLNDEYDVQRGQNALMAVASSDAWLNCENILKKAAIIGTRNATVVNTACPYKANTVQWTADPCCNKALAYTQCCAPRSVKVPYPALTGINTDYVVRTCDLNENNIVQVLDTFNNYIADRSAATDRDTGCFSARLRALGNTGETETSKLWSSLQGFIGECGKEIFGDNYQTGNLAGMVGKQCKLDSDCYTSCVYGSEDDRDDPTATGNCLIPWKDQSKYLVQCYWDRMDSSLKSTLARQWGLLRKNMTDFAAEFESRVTTEQCTGENSYAYRAGYYIFNSASCFVATNPISNKTITSPPVANVPNPCAKPSSVGKNIRGEPVYNFTVYSDIASGKYINIGDKLASWMISNPNVFYVPSNRTACLNNQQCNYVMTAAAPGAAPNCLEDKLFNGGSFCGKYRDGISYFDISVPSYCSIEIPAEIYNIATKLATTSSASNQMALACQYIGGTYVSTPEGTRCVNTTRSTKDACLNQCFSSGPNPQVPQICFSKTITDSSNCYKKSKSYGFFQTSYDDKTKTYKTACVVARPSTVTAVNYASWCASLSGTDFSVSPMYTAQADIDFYQSSSCRQSYCTIPQANTETLCNQANLGIYAKIPVFNGIKVGWGYTFWNPSLNATAGQCAFSFTPNMALNNIPSTATVCQQLGFRYYQGHSWKEGSYDTVAKCSSGMCNWNPALSPVDCVSEKSCSRSCRGCVRDYRFTGSNSICVHQNQTACNVGKWTKVNSTDTCVYTDESQFNQCMAVTGSKVVTCDSLNRNSCWNNVYNDFLKCNWGYTSCPDQDSCNAIGTCNDYDFQSSDFYGDFDDLDLRMLTNPSAFNTSKGTCLLRGQITNWGYRDCSIYKTFNAPIFYSKAGCILKNVAKSTCLANGGSVVERARNKDQCLALKGCCERGNDCRNKLTDKSADECSKCGGTMQSYFTWTGGDWNQGYMTNTTWNKRQLVPKNSWTKVVNMQVLHDELNRAISARISEIVKNEMVCRFTSTLSYLKMVACSCGINQDESCAIRRVAETKQVASGELMCGEERQITSGGMKVTFDASSLQDCDSQATFEISKVEPQPLDNSASNSTVTALNKRATVSANCYAYAKNSFGAYVGQLRGDCVVLNPSARVSNVEICMSLKDTIPWDSETYPNATVALRTIDSNSNEVYTIKSTYSIYESNRQFCVKVSEKGTFCPVSGMIGFSSITNRPLTTCNVAQVVLEQINSASANLTSSAVRLKFANQPMTPIVAGQKFAAMSVQFLDAAGNVVTNAAATAVITISSSNGASLIGVTRVAATNGIATFDNLAVNLAGFGYKLVVSASFLQVDTTSAFEVVPSVSYGLSFATQPAGAVINAAFLQQPLVTIVDAFGNKVTSATDAVKLTAYIDDTADTFISGTDTVNSTAGAAIFTNLALGTMSSGYTLVASSGSLISATSVTFSVVSDSGFPVRLRFANTIGSATFGTPFSIQPRVEALDAQGQIVAAASGSVTVSIKSGTGMASAKLLGTKTLSFANGVAKFTDLSISTAGNSYQLMAKCDGLASDETTPFSVVGPSNLYFYSSPSGSVNGSFPAVVHVRDLNNNMYTQGSLAIYLSIKPFTGNSRAILAGVQRVLTVNGVASFSSLSISLPGSGYVLLATDENNILKVESAPFSVVSSDNKSNEASDPTSKIKDIINQISNFFNLSAETVTLIAGGIGVVFIVLMFASIRQRYAISNKIYDKKRRPNQQQQQRTQRQRDMEAQVMMSQENPNQLYQGPHVPQFYQPPPQQYFEQEPVYQTRAMPVRPQPQGRQQPTRQQPPRRMKGFGDE